MVENGRAGLGRHYLHFLALAVLILILLVALGTVPTRRWGGDPALLAMATGLGIALVAALAGTLPICLARGRKPHETVPMVMMSVGVRLMVALLLAFAAVTLGGLVVKSLVVWLVVGHAALMVADLRFTKSMLYGPPGG